MKRQQHILSYMGLKPLDEFGQERDGNEIDGDETALWHWKILVERWRRHDTLLTKADFKQQKTYYTARVTDEEDSLALLVENLNRLEALLMV